MRVLIHPDPVRLELELMRLVDTAHPKDGVGRTVVVLPTVRLARHVVRRLADTRPAWLGVEVVGIDELPRRILESTGTPLVPVVRDRVLDEIARRAAADERETAWGRFVERRPRALSRLRRVFDDLRLAGVDAESLAREGGPATADLAALYARYEKLLGRAVADRAELVRAAVELAPRWARDAGSIFLHGAYELVGLRLELLRALDRVRPVTALVPCSLDARAYAYSKDFLSTFLSGAASGPPERLADLDARDRRRGSALEALFDEAKRPEHPAPVRISFRHAQGPRAEVEAAVLSALAAIADGCPPHEIAIVARSLEPYAASIEAVFADHGLPFESSVEGPLRRQPLIHDLLLLLRVLDEDFPRRPTVELLRSPRVNWAAITGERERPSGERADEWSRRARILGGVSEWRDDLPAWVDGLERRGRNARDTENARRIARAVEGLSARAPGDQPFAAHAKAIASLVEELFATPELECGLAARRSFFSVLEDLAALETLAGRDSAVPFSRARRWIEEAVSGLRFEPSTGDRGLRVLDMTQLRGMTFRRIMLLGLNSGVYPKSRPDNPVLPDTVRESLQQRLGLPLPPPAGLPREERLLLAVTVGAASDCIEVSWQRAEETGRARAASLALRELGRIAFGAPRPPRPDERDHVPSHPTHALQHTVDRTGLLAPRDGRLLLALSSHRPRGLARLGARHEDLAPRLEMLGATQEFRFGDTRFDARIGARPQQGSLSVSAFERLGRCPLQFFFRDVLKVRELETAADPFVIDQRSAGSLVHDRLERVYRTLLDEGLFDADDPARAVQRALDLLAAERDDLLGEEGHRMRRRLPELAAHYAEVWHETLAAFVRWDIPRIKSAGARVEGFEQEARERIDLGESVIVEIHGRFDRLLRLPDGGAWIGDYKTSGNIDAKTGVKEMLKARHLQVALYRELGGETARVELLGVGPKWDEPQQAEAPELAPERREALRDTLRTFVDLLRRGVFPFRPSPACSWCAYAAACRRTHPPSLERQAAAPEGRELARIARKSTRNLDGR